MIDLQVLKQELAEKQKAKQAAAKVAFEAEEAYLLEFEKWQEEHPEIVSASKIADVQEKEAKAEFQKTRKRIIDELSEHFAENPDDAKLEAAFGLRRSVEAVYEDKIEFIQAVVKAGPGMLFMLKPDDEAINDYVKGMAKEKTFTVTIKGGKQELTGHVIPPKVFDCLPKLGIKTVTKATISDSKLQD